MGKKIKAKMVSSSQIIIVGFAMVILIGSLLLMLPISSRSGSFTSFGEALFTATSATCVTGLVVCDTATHWSLFGQIIILMLIQIGGMGVVTVSVAISVISGRKIGLMQRSTMQEAISAPMVGGIVRMTNFIIKSTIIIELLGAIFLMPTFIKEFGGPKGAWYSVFHSISAFCNAGFDLMGAREKFSSLTYFYGNPAVNFVIIMLIIIGGISFLTWDDVRTRGIHIRSYRLQSKVILATTLALIAVPFLFFFCYEFGRSTWDGLSLSEKIWSALFQAVTPRTAGFNTVDLASMSDSSKMFIIILMLIGGSPGSTAGGMKTTTFAVLLITLFSVFRRKNDVECFGRRISDDIVKNAATVLVMYITLAVTGGIAVSCLESMPLMDTLFESASAIGTAGLTLGITTSLGAVSRVIMIILMFLGRVGGLTLIFATLDKEITNSKLPKEKITVG